MYIKSLMVHNFKSIDTVQIDFNPMTMIIGANATGKSNIINVFRFIEDIMTDGIENAIALQGGIQYIANANLSRGEPIEIQFTIDLKDEGWIRHIQRQKYALEVEEIVCRFVIHPNKRGMGYNIAYDYIKMIYDCNSYDSSASKDERYAPLGIEYSTEFERKNRNSSVKIIPNISNSEQVDDELKRCLHEDSAGRYFSFVASEDKSELMLYRLSLLLPPYFSENTFIRIFDLDPKELKKPSSMVSTKILDENGAKSTRHSPACSHNFPKAGDARFQGRSRLFCLLGKFPYLDESRRILMAVSSKTSSKTRFYYTATRRISSAAVQPSIWA